MRAVANQHRQWCPTYRVFNPPAVDVPHGDPHFRRGLREAEKYAALHFDGDTGETRVIDPNTGGEKGSKLARWDLMPFDVLNELAEHFGIGARKYEDRNWERGYDWGLSLAALCRHLAAWSGGEDTDPESGDSHLIAVMWHAAALRAFQIRGLGTDTRSK